MSRGSFEGITTQRTCGGVDGAESARKKYNLSHRNDHKISFKNYQVIAPQKVIEQPLFVEFPLVRGSRSGMEWGFKRSVHAV